MNKATTKVEYRVVKEATNPPYYGIQYVCFDEKGEVIVWGEPVVVGGSIKELRDTLTEMQQALDMKVMDGIETGQIAPERL